MSAYTDLTTKKFVEGGLAEYFLIARREDITTLKCPIAPEKVLVVGPHVFVALGGFAKVSCAPEYNNMEAVSVGEKGSLRMMKKFTTFLLGSESVLHQFIANHANDGSIILFKDASCGEDQWYQLGCDCFSAYVDNFKYTSGTTKDGRKGYHIEYTVPAEAVQIYTGVVPLLP